MKWLLGVVLVLGVSDCATPPRVAPQRKCQAIAPVSVWGADSICRVPVDTPITWVREDTTS